MARKTVKAETATGILDVTLDPAEMIGDEWQPEKSWLLDGNITARHESAGDGRPSASLDALSPQGFSATAVPTRWNIQATRKRSQMFSGAPLLTKSAPSFEKKPKPEITR